MNRETELNNCLQSIHTQNLLPAEVIIVNGSSSFITVKTDYPFPVHVLNTKPGLPYQRNQGLAASTSDVIIFLDDDVILEKDFIYQIIQPFQQDNGSQLGAVSARITNIRMPGWPNRLLSSIFGLSGPGDGKFKKSGFPTDRHLHPNQHNIEPIECLPGCGAAYHKKVFEEFQFDELMGGYAYMEDDDFSFRIGRKFKLLYNPKARLQHLETPTARGNPRQRARLKVKCYHYYFKKNWPRRRDYQLAHYWALVGMFVSALLSRNGNRLSKAAGVIDGIIDSIKGNIP
jgi:GT2 family glycosyltransferase